MGYLFTFLKPHHAYLPNWQELRRRRRQAWIAILLFVPAVPAFGVALLAIGIRTESAFEAIVAAYMALIVWLNVRVLYWPCPRCGRPFALSWWRLRSALMNDYCLHCELPRYAPCDPAEQQWEIESHAS